jgi:hypothetical protein
VTLETIEARLHEADPWDDTQPLDLEPIAARVDAALEEAGIEFEPFDRFRG